MSAYSAYTHMQELYIPLSLYDIGICLFASQITASLYVRELK